MGQIVTVFFFCKQKGRKVSNLHHGNWEMDPCPKIKWVFSKRSFLSHNDHYLRFMSGHEQKFSSPIAPAAKSIYGPCAGDWHVTSLKGNVTSIKQECSDGTSHIYESRTVSWKTHDARAEILKGSWVPSHLSVSVRKQQVLRETW